MKKLSFYILLPVFFLITFSCEEIVLEDDISEEIVQLVAPMDKADFFSTGITFTWEPIESVTQYRIQIARPNFTNPLQIVADTIVKTTSFSTQLNIGDYEWRVKGLNSAYNTVYSTRSLKVSNNEDFQNNNVTLSLPVNNTITNIASQNLVWQSLIDATAYRVQIVNPENNAIISEQDVTLPNLNYTFPQGTYQWKVRATNGNQNTLYSTRSITIDTTAPNTPTLTAPADQSNMPTGEIAFQWSRVPISGSAEKDSIYIFKNINLTNLQYKNVETSPYNTSALASGTYYWFVRSFDKAGNMSQQSAIFSFKLN